ncbi:carboxypeptidase regulatory-like domain-containing protein [Silvibacterium sp.]|uniref:TonB-dependent receptor n=1 Tax=Silvibacterium sp. TaxID=1964179 RepID=UPI0039E29DD6
MKRICMLALACLAMCLFASASLAQTVNQSITGQVTDPSGAVIPGAQVIAHNIDTGVDTPTKTNESGFYRADYLAIGHYSVSITANGFQKAEIPAFSLEIHQIANFNVKLELGSAATTVNVSAAAPILDTNDATLSSTFTSNIIGNFPLNGQDFSAITLYMPGSIDTAGTSGTTGIERSTQYTDTPSMNGNRAQANNYTLDGIDMNETFNNLISYSPAPQALEQIQVMTANAPAAYGNVNGGDVVSVLKSGTNQFHGSVYGLVQDYRLNANSWQNDYLGNPINPFSQAQFGATFGGPIIRDKLFFFVDYLGSRHHSGGVGTASVFTAAERTGDFSDVLSQYGVQLYNPENNFAPYANNQITINNPVAKFLFANPSIYPAPNREVNGNPILDNYTAPTRSYSANNQGDIKIEYDPSATDKITGFYSMSTAYDGSVPVLAISFPGVDIYPTKLFGANWVHTFSPALINSAHIGFTRTIWDQALPVDTTGKFGTNGDSVVGISFANQQYDGFTYQGISSGTITGMGNEAFDQGLTDNTYSYIDDVTWQRGLHTIAMGIQAVRYQNNYPTSNNNGYLGSLSYSGAYTNNLSETDGKGWGPADFVLDRVNSAAVTLASNNVGQRQWRIAGYVQDDYKATPKLTLNIGVRWEFDQPWVEQNNKTGNIDLATGQVQYEKVVPVGAPAGSGICAHSGCYEGNYRQWQPRLGFSWQATDRFVVRGGYGATSFYEGNSSNQRLTSITPFIQAVNVTTVAPTAGNPGEAPRTAEQGFSGGTTSYGGTYNVYPQDIQPAYIQEWNLTTEYALTHTLSLQVGYIGEQGQHIEDYGNVNQYLVNGDPTSAPYYNNQYIGVNAPDPSESIGSNPLLITESRAMMNYNALQSVLRQRLSHGLEFTVNYTYGKAMTNSLGNYSLGVNGYSGAFQNYYNSGADYGPAGYDATHNLSFTPVYALPVGRGQEFGRNVNRWLDEVIGGWKLSAAGVIWSGFPETATGPGNNSQSYGESRPNQYRKIKVVNRSIEHWYGTDPSATDVCPAGVDDGICAFGLPASNSTGGTAFGTARNGSLRAPDYKNVDMSAFKDFHTFKEQLIGFRFDAFNAFNLVSYGNPQTGVNSATFGQIAQQQSIRSTERRLQFSAHYNF